jgi:hypothetical protein
MSRIIMPTSYLTLKPPTNPPLSSWLAWSQKEFANINPNLDQVAALIGLDRNCKIIIIYKPVPIVKPDGTRSTIIGNMTTKKANLPSLKLMAPALAPLTFSRILTKSPPMHVQISPSPPI